MIPEPLDTATADPTERPADAATTAGSTAQTSPSDSVITGVAGADSAGADQGIADVAHKYSTRAAQPFVFRTGHFGTGTKVWTIRDAAAHMDRYPDDGIFHLRNGTLSQWFEDQGAGELAALARSTLAEERVDRRIALETFLIRSGMVVRPQLVTRPRRVDLGYVLVGDSSSAAFVVSKGRGRGYLHGSFESSEPWLRLDPRSFAGGPVKVTVQADTDTLPISAEPQAADVLLRTNATEEAVAVPVRLLVRGMSSPVQRRLIWPLCGLLVGGLLGAGAGLFLELSGALLFWPAGLGLPAFFWPWMLVAAVWAVFGCLRGAYQPPAWPLGYALARWLARLALWAAGLVAFALAFSIYWPAAYGGGLVNIPPLHAAAWALAISILPATLREIGVGRAVDGSAPTPLRRPARLPAGQMVFAVLFVVALLVAPFAARPASRLYQGSNAQATVQGVAGRAWDGLNTWTTAMADRINSIYSGH